VSRIDLSLVPTHPDRVGGLGFLSNTVHAFAVLAVAHGALLAGMLANRIFWLGATLPQFKAAIAVVVVFVLCVVLAPLLVFAPQLAQAKRTGMREYGALTQRYVREFDAKWLRGRAPADEPLVGSGDIQSLADLGNSYEVVRTMRILPVTKEAILRLGVATLVPLAPLALTMMPLEELLKKLFGVLFGRPWRQRQGVRSTPWFSGSAVHLSQSQVVAVSALVRGRRTSRSRWCRHDSGADVLEQSLEFRRVHHDGARRCAQAIDGLGGQHERRRLLIQIVQFRLVLQRRERHVDGVDLGARDA